MWFRKIGWYISGIFIELRQILILLIFAYLATLINIVILRILTESSVKEAIFRFDIVNSAITTSITLLFATQVIRLDNDKIRESKGYCSILIIIFSLLISVFITIYQEGLINTFDTTFLKGGAISLIVISILIIILSKFQTESIKQFVEQQQKAYDSRKISTTEVAGKNIKLD